MLSHNTVYLGGRTHGLTSGSLRFGYTGPEVHVAAGEAERQVHPDCSLYRRVLAIVDLGPGRCCAADFFRLSGTMRREYVFHGLGGEEGPGAHVDEVSAVSLGVEPFEAAGLRVLSGDRVDGGLSRSISIGSIKNRRVIHVAEQPDRDAIRR